MTLNRDDFPTLTDEQWENLQAEFQAEGDRRASSASETARQNARKGYVKDTDVEARVAEALEQAGERAKMDAAQLLEADRKALDAQAAQVAADRRALKVQKALTDAGLPADKVNALIPMFVNVDDKQVDTTVEGFVSIYQDEVKTKVDAEKQALLDAAQAPSTSTDPPVGLDAKAADLLSKGDEVGAIDVLLTQAGYTTP